MDPANGYVKDNSISIVAVVTAQPPEPAKGDTRRLMLRRSHSGHTAEDDDSEDESSIFEWH